jgi:hypothetical protein
MSLLLAQKGLCRWTCDYGMVWYGMVWYGMVWYGMVWYGMVWYGMVWYGMVWYGMVARPVPKTNGACGKGCPVVANDGGGPPSAPVPAHANKGVAQPVPATVVSAVKVSGPRSSGVQ